MEKEEHVSAFHSIVMRFIKKKKQKKIKSLSEQRISDENYHGWNNETCRD